MKKKKILGKRTDGEDRQKFGGKQIKIIIVGKRGKTWKLTTKSWAGPPPLPILHTPVRWERKNLT